MVAGDAAAARALGAQAQGVPEQDELLRGGFDHGFLHACAALRADGGMVAIWGGMGYESARCNS
ncbi:hypothetical protein D3C80_1041160 [compost metagenome]